jgi:hypothetical protein
MPKSRLEACEARQKPIARKPLNYNPVVNMAGICMGFSGEKTETPSSFAHLRF